MNSITILVIDNRDSFVHTIIGYLRRLGAQCVVVDNTGRATGEQLPDAPGLTKPASASVPGVRANGSTNFSDALLDRLADFSGVLVSPGPGTPVAAGISMAAIARCAEFEVPMLGVCLGHQALAECFGARVSPTSQLMHGQTSQITHNGSGVFAGLPKTMRVTRYHSLAVESATLPDELQVTAWGPNETVMGLQHYSKPLHGVQFHPESILSEHGYWLFGNWLAECGVPDAAETGRKTLVR